MHAGLVVVDHLVDTGELVVYVPCSGNTVLIIEITYREAVIAVTIETNVALVPLGTVRQRIESVGVVTVVVEIAIISLQVINEL